MTTVRAIDIDDVSAVKVIGRIQLGVRATHAGDCADLAGGVVAASGRPLLAIPEQRACVAADHSMSILTECDPAAIDEDMASALLAHPVHVDVRLVARSPIPWLTFTVQQRHEVDASGAVEVRFAADAVASLLALRKLAPSPAAGSLRRMRTALRVFNPTRSAARLRITSASLTNGERALGDGGSLEATLAPRSATDVDAEFQLALGAPLVAGAELLRSAAIRVCLDAPTQLCVGERCRTLRLRACRDVGPVELARAVLGDDAVPHVPGLP